VEPNYQRIQGHSSQSSSIPELYRGYVHHLPASCVSFWEIYNIRSNSWRKINIDMPPSYLKNKNKVYINGVSHWLDDIKSDPPFGVI